MPVLLSVGYAACHWCHVMAHESFEDEATAALMNEQRRRHQGGPRGAARHRRGLHVRHPGDDRPGRLADDRVHDAGRRAVLVRDVLPARPLRAAGDRGRGRLETEQGPRSRASRERIRQTLAENAAAMSALGGQAGELDLEDVTATAVAGLAASFDRAHGGLRPARRSSRRRWRWSSCSATTSGPGQRPALAMAEATCEAMARGGMYDQLGGGFARYSVDASWTVPHFEKMLYDNALLAGVYTHLWRRDSAGIGRPARPPGRRGDLRLHAQGAAHARGRLRRLARRRQRRQRGRVLRLDSGPAARGPRRGRRRLRGRRVRGHARPGRSSTARRCCSA